MPIGVARIGLVLMADDLLAGAGVALYERMLRVRHFEEMAARLYRRGLIPGFLHVSIGQEATAIGATWPLRTSDHIISTHRGHGHCLGKGADMTAMFAELMGRASGCCGGRGGSMHIVDMSVGILGANGIVGAGLPIAVGAAAGLREQGRPDAVVVAFFGDGAVAQGTFHEAVNLAALWKLPVLFFCENNHYAEFSHEKDQHPVGVAGRAAAYGIEARTVDGNDVLEVVRVVERAVAELRAGSGPLLIEASTYRWHGHYEGDPERYREASELEEWKERDPLTVLAGKLDAAGMAAQRQEVEAKVEAEVAAAAQAAEADPEPPPEDFALHVQAERALVEEEGSATSGEEWRVVDAFREALGEAMAADPSVWVAGIDMSAGNIYNLTRGIADRFPGRVLDTPISESVIMGLGVGGALVHTKPFVEIMYLDFVGVCFDQLLNQAAKLRFMSGGQADMSLVVHTQFGAGRSSAAQHSQSLEALLAHIPGLSVVMPSNAADTYGLLRAAIEDPNPILFIDNRHLYAAKGPRPSADHRVPIGKGKVVRAGGAVTVVSWSRMVADALVAAEEVAAKGIDVEVIDLRTVAPFDEELVLASVAKTGRLVIAHEAVGSGGLGGEIAARVADAAFWDLDAPVVRVAAPFTPAPYARGLEERWLPSSTDIVAAIERTAAV